MLTAVKFCCLNPDERGVMRGTAIGLAETLYFGFPKVIWDALWLPGVPSLDDRKAAFLLLYDLEVQELDFGDPPVPTELITTENTAFWIEVGVLILLPAGSCPDGCTDCVPYPCA